MASRSPQGPEHSRSRSEARRDPALEADEEPFVLPLRKTSPLAYVVGAGVAVIALGLILFAARSTETKTEVAAEAAPTSSEVKPAEPSPSAPDVSAPSAAPIQVAPSQLPAESAQEAAPEPAPASGPETEKAPKVAAQSGSTKPKSTVTPTPAKKPATAAQSSKKASALDALGADITSQLK